MIWDFDEIAVTLLPGICHHSYSAGFSHVGAALCSLRHSSKRRNSRLLITEHVIIRMVIFLHLPVSTSTYKTSKDKGIVYLICYT